LRANRPRSGAAPSVGCGFQDVGKPSVQGSASRASSTAPTRSVSGSGSTTVTSLSQSRTKTRSRQFSRGKDAHPGPGRVPQTGPSRAARRGKITVDAHFGRTCNQLLTGVRLKTGSAEQPDSLGYCQNRASRHCCPKSAAAPAASARSESGSRPLRRVGKDHDRHSRPSESGPARCPSQDLPAPGTFRKGHARPGQSTGVSRRGK